MRKPRHRSTARVPLWEHVASWFAVQVMGAIPA